MKLRELLVYFGALALVAGLAFAEKEAQRYCDNCGRKLVG
jgi:hypothetical protein